jgi:hypothetical protein
MRIRDKMRILLGPFFCFACLRHNQPTLAYA